MKASMASELLAEIVSKPVLKISGTGTIFSTRSRLLTASSVLEAGAGAWAETLKMARMLINTMKAGFFIRTTS